MTPEFKALVEAVTVMIAQFWRIARDEDGEMPRDVAAMIQASTDSLAAAQAASDEPEPPCSSCQFGALSPLEGGPRVCKNKKSPTYGMMVKPDSDFGCNHWAKADEGEGKSNG